MYGERCTLWNNKPNMNPEKMNVTRIHPKPLMITYLAEDDGSEVVILTCIFNDIKQFKKTFVQYEDAHMLFT